MTKRKLPTIAGRFGPRYGATLRKRWNLVMLKRVAKYRCPRCHSRSLVRESVGLKVGDVVEVYVDAEGRIVIEKVRRARKRLRAGRRLSPEEIEELIERGLKRGIQWQ